MVQSKATTVKGYLEELPAERRSVVEGVRTMFKTHMPAGYEEAVSYGMIGWQVPLARCPDTYNGQPLAYAGIAAQKNGFSLYLSCAYVDPKRDAAIRKAFADAGKKLDMGKVCIRFKKLEDLPLDAIGKVIGAVPVKEFISHYEKMHPPKGVKNRA